MKRFEKLYGRLRRRLPKAKGEVKGRTLSESELVEVAQILRKIGAVFEVVVIDIGMHSKEELLFHKAEQAEAITTHLTSEHHPSVVEAVWMLRRQLEDMPLQLYVQSVAMGELVYQTLNHASTYFAFRIPSELGEYHWRIDGKDRLKITRWEKWWSTVVLPMLESKTFRDPLIAVEGGDYRWQEQFRKRPDDYKLAYVKDAEKGEFFDLGTVIAKNFCFSSVPEFGLEAVDIVTNAIRRSLSGNFTRAGWIEIPKLMIHRQSHCIRLITLSRDSTISDRIPYANVLRDFRHGGRAMFPRWYYEKREGVDGAR
ncbi:MAG: hypothetical protein OXI01_23190 [Albidovulum sp.]|nr:hypothetical protein [Albidovulum sp.]